MTVVYYSLISVSPFFQFLFCFVFIISIVTAYISDMPSLRFLSVHLIDPLLSHAMREKLSLCGMPRFYSFVYIAYYTPAYFQNVLY